MHKTIYRLGGLFLTLITLTTNVGAQQHVNMLVGTYTYGNSLGIYSFRFDQTTGKVVSALDSLRLDNPSFLTLSADGKLIYAVSETHDEKASMNIINYRPSSGKMNLVASVPTEGEDPCYVETNGNLVLTANYSGGSMSVFKLNKDGQSATLATRFLGATGGPNMSRQETPHVHCARFAPDGRFILATDFSADRICSYRLQGSTVAANGVAAYVRTDDGPRHLIFSRNGRFAYAMSELSGKVSVFAYKEGRLQMLQTAVSDSVGARGGADLHLSPDGRFLYSSNRLKAEGLAIFAVDKATGKLKKVGYQPTAQHPRHFNITPNGRFLLCACRDSDKIQVFRRDLKTGLLTDTGQDIHVSKAVCVQFGPCK